METTDVTTRCDGGFTRDMPVTNDGSTAPGQPYLGHAQDLNINPVNVVSLPDGRTIRVRDWKADAPLGDAVLITLTGVLCAPNQPGDR